MPLILAKSSSGDCYEVSFEVVDGRVFARCGCAAGNVQQLCKHLIAFLSGDCSMLFRSDQEPELLASLRRLDAAGILAAFADLQSHLTQLDAEMASVKRRIEKERKGRKAAFMRTLAEGYPAPLE